MRFLGLDLERYGPFTGRGIHFREEARLHVVHGPNEAGKSTALAAIGDLLFGFPPRASQDFLHRMQDLRIGARIVNRAGDRLSFRRRRGNLRTLIDAEENALANDALVPFLGGLTRDVFARAFGLSTETLRKGGKDMLEEKGDVGSALFAAASGLQGSSELKRSLDAEAERIFDTRSAGHRRFYQALDRWEAARKAMREHELRGGDWKELNERIALLQAKRIELDRQRAERAAERARLLRLKRAAPLIALLDQGEAEIDEFKSIGDPPPGFGDRLRLALDAEERAAQTRKARAEDLQALIRERDGLIVDQGLVARSAEIAALFAATGEYAKARKDLPGVDRDAEGLRRKLANLAKRLGLADPVEIERWMPSDADLTLLRSLCKEGREIEAQGEELRVSLARERETEAGLSRDRAARGGEALDPEPLRERLAALAPVLQRLEQRQDLEGAIHVEEQALAEAGSRLDPPIASLDAIAAASLPTSDTMARFRKQFETLGKGLDRAREEAEATERSCQEIELALERLSAGRAVPTSEAIAAERAKRDAAWTLLRPALFDKEVSAELRSSAVGAFERHGAQADRLADEALGDAARVAEHALRERQLASERERRRKAVKSLADIEAREQKHEDAWRAAWAASNIVPLPPAEMASWSAVVAALLARRAKLQEQRQLLCALEARERAIAPALGEIARSAGLKDLDRLAPPQIVARLETRILKLSETWKMARGLDAKAEASRERIAQLQGLSQAASERLADWTGRWSAALPKLGLSPDAILDQTERALLTWAEVPAATEALAKEERRVAGMLRDNAEFEGRAAGLVEIVAADLASAPADIAIKTLHERAALACAAAARRDDCVRRVLEASIGDEAAEATLGQARSLLGALAKEAGLGESGSLRPLLASLDQRATLEADLRGKRDELLRAADGLDEATLRAELADFEPSMAEKRLAELGQEEESLVTQGQEAYAAQQQELSRKAALEAGFGAELAAQQRRNAEAELTAAAREWAILKLGSLLLGTAIERHREAVQNPLLTRAGKLFSAITGGAFHGLGSRFDEEDRPVLIGRRADGSNVEVDGLSEGTRDQLFLALRLAYVESYATRAEPPPFIADDIFVTFDDERTAHGLVALAGIGARVQPILFTHHRRVVEIARERLGEDVDIVELSA